MIAPGLVTSLDAFLTATRAGLILRAGLAGVSVFSGPILDEKELGSEYILLGGTTSEAFAVVLANEYTTGMIEVLANESYDVPCELMGVAVGTGESGIVAARQRGLVLLNEVHEWLKANDTASATVQDCRITRYKATQLILDEATRCLKVEFTVSVYAQFLPA